MNFKTILTHLMRLIITAKDLTSDGVADLSSLSYK